MPKIYNGDDGEFKLTDENNDDVTLASGSYHAQKLAIDAEALDEKNAIKVGIGKIELLKKEDSRLIYTDSLQSCFPALLKFKNGDLALFHGKNAGIYELELYLKRTDLEEIELFQKGTEVNAKKVSWFINSLVAYFRFKDIAPAIKIQKQDDIAPYGITVCYKSPKGGAVIIVAESASQGRVANNLSECNNKEDIITTYRFDQVLIDDVKLSLSSTHYKHQTNSNKTGRAHVIRVDAKNYSHLKQDYKNQKGDYLKSSILLYFKQRIEEIYHVYELKQLVIELKSTPEYKILATQQGVLSTLFKSQTTSVTAFNRMIQEHQKTLEKLPVYSLI